MDKKKFMNSFVEGSEEMASNIYDKIELCKRTDGIIYTDTFLPPHIWSKLVEIEEKLGILVEVKGLSVESEKKMVAFKSYYTNKILEFPLKLIAIENSSKFCNLEHRHYLAGILSTGIKREKLGDLIVDGKKCYTIISEGLFDFVKLHFGNIGKTKVRIIEVGGSEIPRYKFKIKEYLLASYRLDLIVASLINGSRNESLKLINSSQVTVNYNIKTDKSLMIKEQDVISIRRFGKYVFLGSEGETKKGKIKGKFKKYI